MLENAISNPSPAAIVTASVQAHLEPAANDNSDTSAGSPPKQGGAREILMPPGYRLSEDGNGIEKCVITKEGAEWLWFASRIVVLALVRGFDSTGWAVLLEVTDPDGRVHELTIPRSMLVNDGAALRESLCDLGAELLPTAAGRAHLVHYLSQSASVQRRQVRVDTVGWHGRVFVLPDAAYGITDGTEVVFRGGQNSHAFRVAGTLEDWQQHVARHARGNSRLMLALCTSMAAPLIHMVMGESGGVHVFGASSTGKSSVLATAGSVWGGGGDRANTTSWRTTDNALESIARANCDCGLMLDEIGQADARAVQAVAYMIANGTGKSRSSRSGNVRAPAQWRLSFVSTGEVRLADKLQEAGGKAMAGQGVRVVEVGLPEGGHGIFERIPEEFANAAAFANAIQEASRQFYGTPCRAFLKAITENYDEVAEGVKAFVDQFVDQNCESDADGQVRRVAQRFGLFAAAGELAIDMGILPALEGDAIDGVVVCFRSWLAARGSSNSSAEILAGVAQVQDLLERHGTKHFDGWLRQPGINQSFVEAKVADRWGYFIRMANEPEFYVTSIGFQKLCEGYDTKAIAKELIRLGILRPGADGKSSVSVTVPGQAKARYYHLVPGRTSGQETDDGD